ncbi:major facilitator superfamily domain-containing protein 10 [Holotrichia oblita]|uniref:Major facilitator superfamily domain-containing protein 10 n=1 Tax=Holotrichia oblita TaxID=644536 RepID=A0ACB9TLM6_HOLOL|nr:major facilitator superfamily domain-containing protein 10 [Holotrichia oblita]
MILIYFICFLDFLTLAILMPVAPVHLVSLGASRLLIGGLTSLNALLQLTTGPLVGSWSDTKGRKALLIQCLFLVLISNILLLFTSSLFTYIVSRIIIGLTGHVQILVRAIVASTVPKSEQNETFAKMGAAIGLSLVVGPLLGGVLNSTENGMFKIAVLLNIFTVINLGVAFLISDIKTAKSKRSKEKPILTELTQAFTNLIQVDWNTFWDLFLFRFLRESGYSAFFTTFGVVLMDHLGASQSEMGLTISLFSITMIATNLSMGKIKERLYADDSSGYKRNLHGFIGLTATFGLLYLYTGFYLYIIVMLAMGVFGAVLDATWMEMLVDRTSDNNKGTITGSFESIMQMANLVTPMIATYVEENYGYHKTFLIAIMFLTSGVLIGSYRQRVYQQSVKRD